MRLKSLLRFEGVEYELRRSGVTCAMASSSHSATPAVADVRRARAARFSISPAQDFGSPSFSLGLEKFPPPPTFDDCGEEDLQRNDERESSKRGVLLKHKAAPSFSLCLEDIEAPPTSENCKGKETPDRNRESSKQRHGEETRGVQHILYPSGGENTSSFKIEGGGRSGGDPLETAEERRNNQVRPYKVFSGPSFSLGLESSPPVKSNDANSGEEKQASDGTRAYGDRSLHHSASHFRGEHVASLKSRLFQIFSKDQGEALRISSLQGSPIGNSASPKCDLSPKSSGEVKPNYKTLQGDIPPPSPSRFERPPKSSQSGKLCEEHTPKRTRRFLGLSSPPKHICHVKTEPSSDSYVPVTANDQEILRKRVGSESTSPVTTETNQTSRSEPSPRSHEDQTPESRPDRDGTPKSPRAEKHSPEPEVERFITNCFCSKEGEQKLNKLQKRSREFKVADLTKGATTVSSDQRVGPISRKEEGRIRVSKTGENLPSSFIHTHSPFFDLSQGTDEGPSLEQPKWRQGEDKDIHNTRERNIPVEYRGDSKVEHQQIKVEEVEVVDVSTPPSFLRQAANRRLRNSNACAESDVLGILYEPEFHPIAKRRKLSKTCTQVKAEYPSTSCPEDVTPVDGTTAGDRIIPGSPIAEQKKVFKRLRRGSSSASKDPRVSQAPQDNTDCYAALKKVNVEPRNPCLNPDKQRQASFNDSEEQMTNSSQRTHHDEFDDIEDFSEDDLPIAGMRPQRDRRSLLSQIQPRKLSLCTPSPPGVKKPVLIIPAIDTSDVSMELGRAKAESVTCFEANITSSNIANKLGNKRAEPITLSDDEEERSKVFCAKTLLPEVVEGSTSIFQKQKVFPDHERAGARSDIPERGSNRKGKSTVDGSDLWKSYTEDFSVHDSAGPRDAFTGASRNVYKMCQSEDVRIADLLRGRLPHFKPIDALLLDGGLDQEPVYIDYRNQFGRSQGMDSAAFAEVDCTQPQARRKQKRSSSKNTKVTRAYASSPATNSSHETTVRKSPAKGKRKAWTLFRETKGRASASGSTSGKGYWIVENGKRVYIIDGRTLSGRSAYAAYKKDCGKKSRKARKKRAGEAKR